MSLPTFTKDRSLREQIQGLERVAEEYRKVTNNLPGEHVMLETLVRCLPHALRQHVQLQMSEASTYQSIRDYVLGYEVTTTSWTLAKMHQALGVVPMASSAGQEQSPVPMEVDALIRKDKEKQPKGKGKARDIPKAKARRGIPKAKARRGIPKAKARRGSPGAKVPTKKAQTQVKASVQRKHVITAVRRVITPVNVGVHRVSKQSRMHHLGTLLTPQRL